MQISERPPGGTMYFLCYLLIYGQCNPIDGEPRAFRPNFQAQSQQTRYFYNGEDLDQVILPANVFANNPNLLVSY